MNLFLNDGQEQLQFQEEDFPLAVSITKSGSLCVGTPAESTPIIWILFHHGQFSIQPEQSRIQVFYNGIALDEPRWLEDGDEISLGDLTLEVSKGTAGVTLSPRSATVSDPDEAEASPVLDDSENFQSFGKTLAPNRVNKKGMFSFATTTKIILSIFTLLALGVGYVLVASPVYVRVSPTPDTISISGFPPPIPISDRYLALPGSYVVEARASGYKVLRKPISIAFGASPSFEFALQKLPGYLSVTTPPVDGATIRIDGQARGLSPLRNLEVNAGPHEIHVISKRYLPEIRKLEVRGLGASQTLEIKLKPGWGTFSVNSVPDKALVKMNGEEIGQTPLTYEPMGGSYKLELIKEGWKPVTRKINIEPSVAINMGMIQLEKIDGKLDLKSTPAGATIMVNGKFRGHTPALVPLVSDRDHQLKLSHQGYTEVLRTVRVEGGKTTPLSIRLQSELGTVFLTTNPPGSKLRLNGRPRGSGTQRLRLPTIPHSIEITKPGYVPYKAIVTPRRGIAKKIDITLKTVGAALKEKTKKGIMTPGGQKLRLIYIQSPVKFLVGASRREPGRRANEILYPVELVRSFLISEKEVTNSEFRKFRPRHSSGSYQGTSLDKSNQPAVNVAWHDAARYANWLSKKEGLAPAYKEENGEIKPIIPLTNGYRLPTEAEWEFVSRHDGGQQPLNKPLRFPWGDSMPPPNNSGNYADDHAQRLPFAIPGYVDGFRVSAPVGKFGSNKSLIYDLGGNVAEWVHDFYDIPLGKIARPLRDPSGPRDGRFHVVKGSSWRSGSITELRLSYRDYAAKPRNDVGFRIVRYVAKAAK